MAPGYSNLFSPAWLTLSGLLVGISIADLLSLTPCAHPKRRAGKARPDILCHLDLKPCHPSRRQGDLRWWKEIAGRSPQASSPAKLLPDSHQEAGGGFTGNLYSAKLMPAYWSRNGIAMSSVARHQPHGTGLDGYPRPWPSTPIVVGHGPISVSITEVCGNGTSSLKRTAKKQRAHLCERAMYIELRRRPEGEAWSQ